MNRDIELAKIQIFWDFCQNRYNIGMSASLASFAGVVILLVQYLNQQYGEKTFGLTLDGYVVLLFGLLVLFFMFWFLPIRWFNKTYEDNLDQIQQLLSQLEKGELLPTIREMRRTRKKIVKA